jgi:hypothetical protein
MITLVVFFILRFLSSFDLATDAILSAAAAAFGLGFAGPSPGVLGKALVAFKDGPVASAATEVALY